MRIKACILLTFWITSVFASTQAGVESSVQPTVCDLVKHPLQYKGKLIRVRAQVWSDYSNFWLNDSWAVSMQIGKACPWLPAKFTYPANLIGSSAFGTFTGRLIYESGHPKGTIRVRLLVEHESDIYQQKVQNGTIITPQLYDRSSNTFVRPE